MAPLELEGDTLGKKHQFYNKLLDKAITTNQVLEPPQDNDDVQTLLNIDIASKRRNVDYLLEVLKSEDQLYVSKAIKRTTWLITDPQYAHIINPEHLYTELYPVMTSKAFNKLMLNIRLHLKDEKRVESFYNYIKEKDIKSALKWLQHCSVPFIETEVPKYPWEIPDHLVLRLFEKSLTIFILYLKRDMKYRRNYIYLHKRYMDDLLKTYEDNNKFYFSVNAQYSKMLMKKCPQRIIDNFECYIKYINIKTFAKYLYRTANVQDFLIKHASNVKMQRLYTHSNIQQFVKHMTKENRFSLIKQLFLDKQFVDNELSDLRSCPVEYFPHWSKSQNTDNNFHWYKFAPFNTAFTDLTKIIRAVSGPSQRTEIFQVLLSCAGQNMNDIQKLLQYYRDKHINEPFKYKIEFINYFISKVDTHLLDEETWGILEQLFHSMEVYSESQNNVQLCVTAIIVRHVIQNNKVPDIIENKFIFHDLKAVYKKLKTQEDKDSVFYYLRDFIMSKSIGLNVTVESEFNEAVKRCEYIFNLINNWQKELCDHPDAVDLLKDLIVIKKEQHWTCDLSSLYNIQKSWRRVMFQESIEISTTESVCINALKHDSGLLVRNQKEVISKIVHENVSLSQLLRKIRIYWPNTLAADCKSAYIRRLNQHGGHKGLVIGVCTLLPPAGITDLLQTYAPTEYKINWNETNEFKLSLQKKIAKNVHRARPLPGLKEILMYAKGDYLQYAVPSLNAVLSQLSPNKIRNYLPKLLNAPVPLQKFGVRWAFHKLNPEALKPMFSIIWNSTNNWSIRTILFSQTFELICKQKHSPLIEELWALFCVFIDNLTPDDNKILFKKLGEIRKVPNSIKPQFYTKSYTFLKSLPAKCNCESILSKMLDESEEVMEFLDKDFVMNVMLHKYIDLFDKDVNNIYVHSRVLSLFLLSSKDEKNQIERYQMSLAVILDKYLPQWENTYEGKSIIKTKIENILETLVYKLKYTFQNKMNNPLNIYKSVLHKLETTLSYEKYYVRLTSWKLLVSFVKILDTTELEHKKIAPLFAKTCQKHLKDDLNNFGSLTYLLFSRALKKVFDELSISICEPDHHVEYAKCLFDRADSKEMHFVIRDFLNDTLPYLLDKRYQEIRENSFTHPSDDVKMHYYDLFEDVIFRK